MKNTIFFILFASISLSTFSSAEQSLSSEERNRLRSEKINKVEETLESEEYKNFIKEFKIPVLV